MIIARRPSAPRYSTDAVAQHVRDFAAPLARLETRPEAAPSAASGLDLVGMYPTIFGAVRQRSSVTGSIRAAFGGLSAAAFAVVAFVVGRHH